LLDFLHQRGALGAPVDPVAVAAIRQRLLAHLRHLTRQRPAEAKALRRALSELLQAHAQPAPGPGPAPVPGDAAGVPMPPTRAASLSQTPPPAVEPVTTG
jgi:hypothetical protein